MLPFFKKPASRAPLFLYNTLSKEKQQFKPLSGKRVRMYTCGPTVYDFVHIGNLRSSVFADILRRTLEYAGYEVKHIINITDFGHLVADADDTEDKMTLGLQREGKELTLENMKALGEKYAQAFIDDVKALNSEMPFAFPRASEHIEEDIAFVSTLLEKGYAYKTSDGVYFNTAKFPSYGALGMPKEGNTNSSGNHARIRANPEKHDQRDFALWKFNKTLGWEAPWGKGFPGWHIECTAMATKYLGKSFDIHTGGIDLISVHHNNEIAEAEAVSGTQYVRYWVHGAFITIEGKRIGKSEGNAILLYQLKERGIGPLSYRYLLLTSHYRSTMNFTWESVEGAQTALQRAQRIFADLEEGGDISEGYRLRFEASINDDLNTAEGIALMWEMLKDTSLSYAQKRATLLDFDRVLGLGFDKLGQGREKGKLEVLSVEDIPAEIDGLVQEREQARHAKDWERADALRLSLKEKGFEIEDGPAGPLVRPLSGGGGQIP